MESQASRSHTGNCEPPLPNLNVPPANFRDYMNSKQDKLRQQFQFDASVASKSTGFFENVHVYVNGYTEPDSLTIKNMLAAHGGVWEQYNGSHVTHIVASQLPHNKIQKSLNATKPKIIVKPDWVVACVESGRKLPEHDYLLTGTSYTLAATYAVSSLGQMQVSDAVAASTMHANVTHETTNEVLSMHPTDSQHAHVDFGNEGDAGEHILSSASDQDDGIFEDVIDVPYSDHAAPTAAAAAETNSSIIDPGINGKSTEAWVAQFFAQSRLHYIGSWQQRYERIKASCTVPAHHEQIDGRFWTFHVDMDCFFVSVSLKSRPELIGQPVAVSHGSKTGATGEISCASYEARNLGVRAGMFMKQALELCPKLQVLPYEFELYDDASEKMYRVLLGITSSVEAVSCDEAFLFLRASDPHAVINRIRHQVLESSGCICSVGCSDSGKLIARMATHSAKPNNFRVVDSSILPIPEFLDPLPVGDLPGVGWSTRQKLQGAGLNLCQNVRLASMETVKSLLGQALGLKLHRICSGIDVSPIDLGSISASEGSRSGVGKDSIGVQMSWGVRLTSIPHVQIFLRCLAVELCSRAAKAGIRGSWVTLKLWIKSEGAPEPQKYMGHGICYQVSKSGALPQLSAEVTANDIMPVVIALFTKCSVAIPSLTAADVRGVGITMSRLQFFNGTPAKQQRTYSPNRPPAELIRASHQPLITSRLASISQLSKISASSLDVSLFKRPLQPPPHTETLDARAPAEKRQWREPPISSSQLDHNVLAALPPELRRQVQDDAKKVSALKKQNKEFNSRSTFDIQPQEHDCDHHEHSSRDCPEALSIHVAADTSRTGNGAFEEILQLKHSISGWMAIGPPEPYDVKLVGGIIRSLVASHCLDSLRSFLLSLARCAHSVDPGEEYRLLWVEWVGRAIEFAQNKVLAEYGAQLCLL